MSLPTMRMPVITTAIPGRASEYLPYDGWPAVLASGDRKQENITLKDARSTI